ncbi:MAG: ABC transporter permease [Chloroflexi bacterium]|nr:MAG: ABC transporter permease [Chloroflexota bacterium]
MTTAILARPTLGQRLAGPLLAAVEFLRLLSRRPVGLAGFVGIVFFLLLAFVAPLFVPFQNDPSLLDIYLTPSLAHPLGTDFQGKDVLNQIVFLDTVIVAITDITLTIPKLILLIAIAAILRPTSFVFLAVILALLQWSSLLRQVRSQVLSLKERDYVEAARSLDLGLFHIVFREILPTMRSYIVIHFILAMTEAMYAQVGIILLGLVPISGSNWGIMLYFAQGQGALFYRDSLWYILSPILAISLVQLSLATFASALEDIFNPRLRGA